MRKALLAALVVSALSPLVLAGGPPDRGQQGRGRRGDPRGFFDRMMGRRDRIDVFNTAERYFEVTEEKEAPLGMLDGQYEAEERAAMAAIRLELIKKYAPLIGDVLGGEQKAKFEKVVEGMLARYDAVEVAKKEFREVLTKLETEQGVEQKAAPDYIPYAKTDIVRRFIKLSDEQKRGVDDIRRDGWGGMREKMRAIPRPQDWRDAAARQKYMDAARKAREEMSEQSAETMVNLLSDEQKKGYQTAAAAYEAYQAKVKAADEAYQKILVEAVGEEKARGRRDRAPQRTRGGEL